MSKRRRMIIGRGKLGAGVALANAACVRCNAEIYYSAAHWLHCRNPLCGITTRRDKARKGGAA